MWSAVIALDRQADRRTSRNQWKHTQSLDIALLIDGDALPSLPDPRNSAAASIQSVQQPNADAVDCSAHQRLELSRSDVIVRGPHGR